MKYFMLLFVFSGCASYFLKEKCEQTNWFNYSQSIAYSGKYLEEDGFIKDCKGVDRINSQQLDVGFKLGREKMCTYEEIYTRGKSGEPVYFDFCDGLSKVQMKSRYDQGLRIFCTESNGLVYGKSGAVYKKVCDPASDINFMKGYRPGRTQYLEFLIKTDKAAIELLNSDYAEAQERQRVANLQYSSIPDGQVCGNREIYHPSTDKKSVEYVCEIDPVVRAQRSDMISRLNSISSEMYKNRNKKEKFEDEIKKHEQELLTLK